VRVPVPKIIRYGDEEIATVTEGPREDESDIVDDWDCEPAEIRIASDVPEPQKHWMLFVELMRLAERAALDDGAIRKRASDEYKVQVAVRLFDILVHSDLYRPLSREEVDQYDDAEGGTH
jgi:hypothetical protein